MRLSQDSASEVSGDLRRIQCHKISPIAISPSNRSMRKVLAASQGEQNGEQEGCLNSADDQGCKRSSIILDFEPRDEQPVKQKQYKLKDEVSRYEESEDSSAQAVPYRWLLRMDSCHPDERKGYQSKLVKLRSCGWSVAISRSYPSFESVTAAECLVEPFHRVLEPPEPET